MTSTNAYMTGKDMLLLPDGSTYHLGAKKGDIYPRIITVGSFGRAEAMSKCLDVVEKHFVSSRLFSIYSGKYQGTGVTIVAIGMGAPMMDFLVREASFICEGPMAIVRVGTCGLFNPSLLPGTVVCAGKGCCVSYVNHSFSTGGCLGEDAPASPGSQYVISKPVQGSDALNALLVESLKSQKLTTFDGLNVAADFFYSTQGRKDSHFDDGDNQQIIPTFVRNRIDSCEMESFTLFQLSTQRKVAPLHVAACHIGILNRVNPDITDNISTEELQRIESACGHAALSAITKFTLD